MKSECQLRMDRCFPLSMALVIFLQTLYQVVWIKIKKEIKKIFYRSQRDIENTYQTELRLVRILPTKGLKLSQSIKPRKRKAISTNTMSFKCYLHSNILTCVRKMYDCMDL